MNQRQMQILVGVVVFATFVIGMILVMLYSPMPGGLNPFAHGQYPLTIRLDKAPGVGRDTPVRKNGVLIGRVASVEDTDEGVEVNVNIDEGRELTTHHVPHVRTSVLGDATIDFETDAARQQQVERLLIEPGSEIVGQADPNPFEQLAKLGEISESLDATVVSLGVAGDEVAELARTINNMIGDEREEGEPSRVSRLMDTTERAMTQFAQTMTSINQIIGDEPIGAVQPVDGITPEAGQQPVPAPGRPTEGQELRQRVRQGLYELPDAIREFRVTMQDTREVLGSADRNLRNLEGLTGPLGERGSEIASSLLTAVDGVDRLVEEFTVLVQALNNREGTLGQLIHNPQLYQNLNNLTLNTNLLIEQAYWLAQRLRPIVEDARVFMHKIALEPGRIVRGAIGKPSPIK